MRITSWMRVSWCSGLLASLAAGQGASYSVQPVPLLAVAIDLATPGALEQLVVLTPVP